MDLFYREYGDGPALVILHGLFGSGGNWHTLARRVFADTHRVLVPDQRNHGRSPHSDEFDYHVLADDLEAFLDARGVDRAVVLGHSMGGKVTMQFALTRPERVTGVVVVDMAPRSYGARHGHILEGMGSVDPTHFERRSDIDGALARYIGDAGVRQLLMKNLERRQEGGYRWILNVPALANAYPHLIDAIDEWATYEGPSLFLRGAKSDYVRDQDHETIRAYFPQAEIATVEDAGHWVHADHPAAFARAVRTFFAEHGI